MPVLHNKYSKEELKKRLNEETFKRITLSFYRYVRIDLVEEFRDELYKKLEELKVLGRIYVANEGINAQLSVPDFNYEAFKDLLDKDERFRNMRLNIAVEDNGKSFYKLIVRVKHKIVADGLDDKTFDPGDVGRHLNAKEFNEALEDPNTVVVDMRNHYESEIGHFEKSILPDADTYKQELPMVLDLLKDKKDRKVLLYCTGGVRCEKASAYLKHQGFKDVNQLYGGIIHYIREVKQEGFESKFKGKNFVFDERLGERIGDEIISKCHQCGKPCDTHTNCANDDCHLLFIQCAECADKMQGCCTENCQEMINLPIEEQRKLRKGKIKGDAHSVYKSRLRPNLMKVLKGKAIKFD